MGCGCTKRKSSDGSSIAKRAAARRQVPAENIASSRKPVVRKGTQADKSK
jgi:hypothetical protein